LTAINAPERGAPRQFSDPTFDNKT
jgi:hypothetical protein